MDFFVEDIVSFYVTVYGGILIGVLFDFNRAIKKNLKFINVFIGIFDIIFWLIVTTISFIIINKVESFDLRYYHFLALFIGFLFYYFTISKFILKVLDFIIHTFFNFIFKTIKYILKISEGFYYILVYTLHVLYDFIFLIPTLLKRDRKSKRNKKERNRINLKIKKRV